LAHRGISQDTLLIVVGDHGEGMGRAPRPYDRGHSMLVYEDSIHVPLFFLNPELPPSTTLNTPCTLRDIFPTIISCEGLKQPPALDGCSLTENNGAHPLFARSIVWWPLAVRAGPFKLILGEPGGTPELFNLASDPAEAVDISEQNVDTSMIMMRTLIRYSCEQFKNDPSFEYGFQFLPTGKVPQSARPHLSDLLKQ
jgi:arylsulfatase A-like enzyme